MALPDGSLHLQELLVPGADLLHGLDELRVDGGELVSPLLGWQLRVSACTAALDADGGAAQRRALCASYFLLSLYRRPPGLIGARPVALNGVRGT